MTSNDTSVTRHSHLTKATLFRTISFTYDTSVPSSLASLTRTDGKVDDDDVTRSAPSPLLWNFLRFEELCILSLSLMVDCAEELRDIVFLDRNEATLLS